MLYNVPVFPCYHTMPKLSVGFCRCLIWASTNNYFLLQPLPPPSFTMPTHHLITAILISPPLSPSPMATTHICRPCPQLPQQAWPVPHHNRTRRVGTFSGARLLRVTWQLNNKQQWCHCSLLLFILLLIVSTPTLYGMSQATLRFSRVTHTCTHQNLHLHLQAWVFMGMGPGFTKTHGNSNPHGVMPSEMTNEPHKGSASVNGHCHAALQGSESHLVRWFRGCFHGWLVVIQGLCLRGGGGWHWGGHRVCCGMGWAGSHTLHHSLPPPYNI